MPTTEIREDLLNHLRMLADLVDTMHPDRKDMKYTSYYAALLDLGDGKPGSTRPQGVRKQRIRQCYQNSWHALDRSTAGPTARAMPCPGTSVSPSCTPGTWIWRRVR
jgi:hypothetical protein